MNPAIKANEKLDKITNSHSESVCELMCEFVCEL